MLPVVIGELDVGVEVVPFPFPAPDGTAVDTTLVGDCLDG